MDFKVEFSESSNLLLPRTFKCFLFCWKLLQMLIGECLRWLLSKMQTRSMPCLLEDQFYLLCRLSSKCGSARKNTMSQGPPSLSGITTLAVPIFWHQLENIFEMTVLWWDGLKSFVVSDQNSGTTGNQFCFTISKSSPQFSKLPDRLMFAPVASGNHIELCCDCCFICSFTNGWF